MNGCGFHKLLLLSECFDATSLCQSDGRCSLLMGSKAEEVDIHPPPFLVCNPDQPLGMGAERQHLSHRYLAGDSASLTCQNKHGSKGQRRLPRLIQLGGCSLLCLCEKIAELARL